MCELCRNGENKINFISGANITSQYATFDSGLIKSVNFCPACGKSLKEDVGGNGDKEVYKINNGGINP